jgi:hypothetical protein
MTILEEMAQHARDFLVAVISEDPKQILAERKNLVGHRLSTKVARQLQNFGKIATMVSTDSPDVASDNNIYAKTYFNVQGAYAKIMEPEPEDLLLPATVLSNGLQLMEIQEGELDEIYKKLNAERFR